MATKGRIYLYDESNVTELYEFRAVQRTNLPQDTMRYVEIEGVRGKGSLIIDAGTPAWDIEIEGVLMNDNDDEGYVEVTVLMDALTSAIVTNTEYTLRFYKTDSTYYSYKVKRISPIEWSSDGFRTNFQKYIVRLRVIE